MFPIYFYSSKLISCFIIVPRKAFMTSVLMKRLVVGLEVNLILPETRKRISAPDLQRSFWKVKFHLSCLKF